MRKIAALSASALAAYLLTSVGAIAADPGFCDGYARSAVDQTRRAWDIPYCAPGARGPRWSVNYRGHYDWCLGARFRDAEAEREARREYLDACRRR